MDEEKIYSMNVKCINLPKEGSFYIGDVYYLKYHRMNDIVWYTCEDSNYKEHIFYESSWERYFNKV